jgi:hypothetical protein
VVIQAVAIGCDAGKKHVALEVVSGSPSRGFDVARRGAAFPIVGVVEDQVELFAGQSSLDRLRVVSVGGDVFHSPAQIVGGFAMQDGHRMPALQQVSDQRPADESGSSDDKRVHVQLAHNLN